MLMDYLNEEKRLAKSADKVAKKREQNPHSKRLVKKAKKIAILQEKQDARLTKVTELSKKQEERVAKAAAKIAASKARTAQNNAEIRSIWSETVGMMRDINHQHAQQRSDMLNNSLNRSRHNDLE